jgi:NAD-dependent dihydropyrimidine dehydrogenase PreA subunit
MCYNADVKRIDKTPKSDRRYINMAYVISDDCISCGSCAAQCPVEAISEGASHYEINPDVCVECGACAAQCPAEAISL